MRPGNPFILGLKNKKSRSRGTKNIAGVGLCTLLSAGFFFWLINQKKKPALDDIDAFSSFVCFS